jgi:hypothetical protein
VACATYIKSAAKRERAEQEKDEAARLGIKPRTPPISGGRENPLSADLQGFFW